MSAGLRKGTHRINAAGTAGVPLVVMPQGRDQADNAARISARGAGVAIKSSAEPAKIAAAVRKVLDDPGCRQAAERLGQAIRADAESSTVVAELEDAVR